MNNSYISGLFDGEGTVCITHMRSPTKNNPAHIVHRLYANITNTNMKSLEAVQKHLGFGTIRTKKQYAEHSNTKHLHLLEFWGPWAGKLLSTIGNDLIIKECRATLAMDFQSRLSTLRYNCHLSRAWVYDYCDKMRQLNQEFGSAKRLSFCKFRTQDETARRYIPAEIVAAIVTSFSKGKSRRELATKYALDYQTVWKIVSRAKT